MSHLRYTYCIPYQEVDASRHLRLYTLENYLLNVAGRASDEQGIGIQYLLPQGMTWIITDLNLQLSYLPAHNETITIETWVEQNSHMLSVRNFRIYLHTGNSALVQIGEARSVWAVLDLQKRELADVFSQSAFDGIADEEKLSIPRLSRMTPLQSNTEARSHHNEVRYSDVDYNGHCNSCKYLEKMLDAHLPDFSSLFVPPLGQTRKSTDEKGSAFRPHWRLDIHYVRELALGAQITLLTAPEPVSVPLSTTTNPISTNAATISVPSTRYQIINQQGETCCNARLTRLQ